jgi:septal ring factor EnvC (AmiA/AmiB activator)
MQRVEEQIGRLKVQLLEMDSRVKKVQDEGWFKELEKVRTEIGDIEEKLSKIRGQLNRPFRKLQKLVGGGEVSLRPESLVALISFVDDPA